MRYYVAPNGAGFNTNPWNTPGFIPGNLVATVTQIMASPSPGGDEIWAAGDNNVLGATHQGQYNLTAPLVINNNTEPLSIYGGFVGREAYLCQRNANINSLNPNFFQNPSILDGGGNTVIWLQDANVCHIDGFIIRNGVGGDGGGVYAGGYKIWFENMVFMDNTAGNDGGGIFSDGLFNAMIKNSIFFRNSATNGGGLRIADGENILLVNLLFNNNQTNGGTGNAIYIQGNDSVKIINNTISGNTGSMATTPSVYCINSPNVEIYNSILYPDTLAAAAGANVTVDYSLLNQNIFGQNPNGFMPPVNPVNPNFVNPAAGDYHLMNTGTLQSPCIDAGRTNHIFPYSSTDLEGKPRFINGGRPSPFPLEVDMGAFEVQ